MTDPTTSGEAPSFSGVAKGMRTHWCGELRPAAVTRGCPRMYADPTEDPRLRS